MNDLDIKFMWMQSDWLIIHCKASNTWKSSYWVASSAGVDFFSKVVKILVKMCSIRPRGGKKFVSRTQTLTFKYVDSLLLHSPTHRAHCSQTTPTVLGRHRPIKCRAGAAHWNKRLTNHTKLFFGRKRAGQTRRTFIANLCNFTPV